MSDEITIELPLPPERLYPNTRIRHAIGHSKLVADTRATARIIAKQALPKGWKSARSVRISTTFWMPRSRDDDNLMAWAKNVFDGVADAIGTNDAYFSFEPPQQVTGKAAGGQRKLVLVVRANA